MRLLAPALILLATTFAAPVYAGEPKPEQTEKEKAAEKPKKICKRVSEMGSRGSKRICMTREEWREFNQGN